MNEFSLICRILGTFFYRQPQDPTLTPLWDSLHKGQFQQHWPLEQDELLAQLQRDYTLTELTDDYTRLFAGDDPLVSPFASQWPEGPTTTAVTQFLTERGMPLGTTPADHFGLLLLAASWLEDQSAADEIQAQLALFEEYLLPWCGTFLGKVEAYAQTGFYRALAVITRGALQAMAEELFELQDDNDA